MLRSLTLFTVNAGHLESFLSQFNLFCSVLSQFNVSACWSKAIRPIYTIFPFPVNLLHHSYCLGCHMLTTICLLVRYSRQRPRRLCGRLVSLLNRSHSSYFQLSPENLKFRDVTANFLLAVMSSLTTRQRRTARIVNPTKQGKKCVCPFFGMQQKSVEWSLFGLYTVVT